MSSLTASMSIALLLAGGATPPLPPNFPKFVGGDKTGFSFAFAGATSVAVVREATGRTYLEHLGEDARKTAIPPGDFPLCTPESLERFARDSRAFCRPAGGTVDLGDCRWRSWCAPVRVAPELARDPRWGPTIVAALRSPCASLTHPETLSKKERRLRARGLAFDVGEMWAFMRCDRFRARKVIGVEYREEYSAYFVRFR